MNLYKIQSPKWERENMHYSYIIFKINQIHTNSTEKKSILFFKEISYNEHFYMSCRLLWIIKF